MTNILHDPADGLSPENTEQLVLYDGPASPCCRRCRITMLEKGLAWDTVHVNIGHLEQRSPEYLRLNPNGLVPTLRHGTRVLFESGVINDYLEAQFPEVPLMPKDAHDIARVRQWQAAELSMARVFRPVMYAEVLGPIKRLTRTREEAEIIARHQSEEPWDLEWELKVWGLDVLTDAEVTAHRAWLVGWLAPLERALGEGPYVLGEQLTQADVSLFPRIQMYPNAGVEVDADRYPNIDRWLSEVSQRPSFAQSAPGGAQNLAISSSLELKAAKQFFKGTDRDLNDIEDPVLRAISQRMREGQKVEQLLSKPSGRRSLPPRTDSLNTPPERPCPPPPAGDQPPINLYGGRHSPEQQRVSMLLDLLQIPHQQRSSVPENLVVETDPNGDDLPVLQAGDLHLSDPTAISDYLLSLAPSDTIHNPDSSYARAVHAMWLALESGTNKEFLRLARLDAGDQTGMDIVRQRIRWKLDILEQQLCRTPYLCGGKLTFADLTWHTRLADLAQHLGTAEELGLPAVALWYDRVAADLP